MVFLDAWPSPAQSQVYHWNSPAGGSFTNPTLWSPVGGPGGLNSAIYFDLGTSSPARYTVTDVQGINNQLRVSNDSLILNISDYTLRSIGGSVVTNFIIGEDGGTGDVVLTGNSGSVLRTDSIAIGFGNGSSGNVSIDTIHWITDGSISVGSVGFSSGTLNIASSAVVSSAHATISDVSSNGTVSVDGTGSALNISSSLSVLSGSLSINGGGAASSQRTNIGQFADRIATVTVVGTNSTFDSSSELNVGNNGSGALTLRDGGFASSGFAIIGKSPGSSGTVTIDGADSAFEILSELRIGLGGSGTLDILAGSASNTIGYMGYEFGSTGTATITGGDSIWSNSSDLHVGRGGIGMLTIADGAHVSNAVGHVGSLSGSSGSVFVSGEGSTWDNSFDLRIGESGSGTMTISDGAIVSNTVGRIGYETGGTGEVVVEGGGSIWNNSSYLFVGQSGLGMLKISQGGTVSNTDGSVGAISGSAGHVTVEDAGSTWTMTGQLAIGGHFNFINDLSGGTGVVTVGSGGAVSVGNTHIFSDGLLKLDGGAFSTATLDSRGVVELGGTLTATGGVTMSGAGVLKGGGTVVGNVTNSGRIAPGNSPGIIDIDGSFEQTTVGVLEIEVGGTSVVPIVLHDQIRVTGTAMLAGRLEVPIISVPGQPPYSPQEHDKITFLTADGGVQGAFNAIVSPSLATVAPELAVRVNAPPGAMAATLEFVKPTEIQLETVGEEAEWSAPGTWTDNVVPDTTNIVAAENQAVAARRVIVSDQNAFSHELLVTGTANTITVAVESGKSLSTTTSVQVGNNGVIELNGGSLGSSSVQIQNGGAIEVNNGNVVSSTVQIQQGGTVELNNGTVEVLGNMPGNSVHLQGGLLQGNGTVRANELIVSSGTLHPGFSPGDIEVDGNYRQEPNGTLEISVEGTAAGDFGTLAITNQAQLGGTLRIDASNLRTFTPGLPLPIVTAGSLTGVFDRVETIGNDDIFFVADYGGAGATAIGYDRGDMNCNGHPLEDADIALFVFGLMNRDVLKFYDECTTTCHGNDCNCRVADRQKGGDFSGPEGHPDGRLDFDDIRGLQDALGKKGMSFAAVIAGFDSYNNNVPEPSSAILTVIGGLIAILARRRRRTQAVANHTCNDHRGG